MDQVIHRHSLRLRLPLVPLAPDSGSAAAPLPGLRPL